MKISGIRKLQIKWDVPATVLLSETDHLLRRFGSIELLQLDRADGENYRLRGEADEILIPLAGELSLEAVDLREGSPTMHSREQLKLQRHRGDAALLPFGVAYRLRSEDTTQVLRISTHHDASHPEDQSLSAVQLGALLGAHE